MKNNKINKAATHITKVMGSSLLLSMVYGMTAYATGGDAVSSSMSGLQDVLVSFITSVGALITLWGIFEWGQAMQSNDGMQQSSSFKRIGGGLIMVIAPQILASII